MNKTRINIKLIFIGIFLLFISENIMASDLLQLPKQLKQYYDAYNFLSIYSEPWERRVLAESLQLSADRRHLLLKNLKSDKRVQNLKYAIETVDKHIRLNNFASAYFNIGSLIHGVVIPIKVSLEYNKIKVTVRHYTIKPHIIEAFIGSYEGKKIFLNTFQELLTNKSIVSTGIEYHYWVKKGNKWFLQLPYTILVAIDN